MKYRITAAYALVLGFVGMSFFVYDRYSRHVMQGELYHLKMNVIEELHDAMRLQDIDRGKDDERMSDSDVEKITKDLISNNPEIIINAIEMHGVNVEKREKSEVREKILKNSELLWNKYGDPVAGSGSPKVKVVEFFDYNCERSRSVSKVISAIMQSNPDVQFIFKERPLLGNKSTLAAKFSIAVNSVSPSCYFDFQKKSMEDGDYTAGHLAGVAKNLGVNMGELVKFFKDKERNNTIVQLIESNARLASELNIATVPTFIIGEELIEGAMDVKVLQNAIDVVRKGKIDDSKGVEDAADVSGYREIPDEEVDGEEVKDSLEISGDASVDIEKDRKRLAANDKKRLAEKEAVDVSHGDDVFAE